MKRKTRMLLGFGTLTLAVLAGGFYWHQSSAGCVEIAHIGDSLTAYTIPALETAYRSQGFQPTVDAHGGRAILQKLSSDPKTGKQAAMDLRASGFGGCWVVALGTNDTANVAVGSSYTRAKAIDEMMAAIDPDKKAKVLWVNARTKMSSGAWHNDNMQKWNVELENAKARWPNLQVFDWASYSVVNPAAYSDGIHHTSAGYEVRNAAIAAAAKRAFHGS